LTVTRYFTANFIEPTKSEQLKLSISDFCRKQNYFDLVVQSIALNIYVKILILPIGKQEKA